MMLQAVIYYIVTMILTKELVIATDQCTEYQFKSPFFPGVSCEDIYTIRIHRVMTGQDIRWSQESVLWNELYWIIL